MPRVINLLNDSTWLTTSSTIFCKLNISAHNRRAKHTTNPMPRVINLLNNSTWLTIGSTIFCKLNISARNWCTSHNTCDTSTFDGVAPNSVFGIHHRKNIHLSSVQLIRVHISLGYSDPRSMSTCLVYISKSTRSTITDTSWWNLGPYAKKE